MHYMRYLNYELDLLDATRENIIIEYENGWEGREVYYLFRVDDNNNRLDYIYICICIVQKMAQAVSGFTNLIMIKVRNTMS